MAIEVTKKVSLLKRPKVKVDLVKSRFLYDWLAFSTDELDFVQMQVYLFGARHIPFVCMSGSNRFYEFCAFWQHIRIYYTENWDSKTPEEQKKYNKGVFVEMSGQGCREFEDYGVRSMSDLLDHIRLNGWCVSRLDVAFDDRDSKHPLFDLSAMASQALRREFTSRSNRFKVDYSGSVSDNDDTGISVQHGSRSSCFYLRVYDKRVERGVGDKISHWVRCEMQLKRDVAMRFLNMLGDIGHKFREYLSHYVNYRDVSEDDSNKRRWALSDWWQRVLDGVVDYVQAMPLGTNYNKGKLDDVVYKRYMGAIITAIMIDGADKFFGEVIKSIEKRRDKERVLPAKYSSLIAQTTNQYPEWLFDDMSLWWEYVTTDQVNKYKAYFDKKVV